MSQKIDINQLVEEITKHELFISSIRSYVDQLGSVKQQNGEKVSFGFEKENQYPWSAVAGNLPIEGQKMVQQISDMVSGIIDHNLHEILNRQFINISNQILIMRDQITKFTLEINTNQGKIKHDFLSQLQQIKKKMIIQNNMGNQKQFTRTRTSGMLNSSLSSSTYEAKSQVKSAEFQSLIKEVQIMKKEIEHLSVIKTVNDRITLIEETLSNQIINFRLKIESVKQKSEKGHQELLVKVQENSNKEYIGNEIKRAVKSYFKVYLEQLNKCKENISKQEQSLVKMDKGLQQYFGNQLKSLWLQFSNMKRRVQSVQEYNNLNNQSFLLD